MIILGGSPTSDILGGLQAGIHTCWFNPAGRSARADITPEYEIQKLQEFSLLLRRI